MNRTLLCSAIEGLASECGYHFQQGDKSYYPTTVCRYPAAFLQNPKFVSIDGQKHGRITYNVSLSLAHEAAKLSPSECSNLICEMEEQMVQIFVALSKNERILLVDNLTISPSSTFIDNHGAITIEAKANVTTIF